MSDSLALPHLLHGKETRVRRPSLPRPGPCYSATCTQNEGLYEPALPLERSCRRDRTAQEPNQVEDPLARRTCLLGDQGSVRICESPVPRSGEETEPTAGDVCVG